MSLYREYILYQSNSKLSVLYFISLAETDHRDDSLKCGFIRQPTALGWGTHQRRLGTNCVKSFFESHVVEASLTFLRDQS